MSITSAKATVGYMVINVFEDNPGALAAWHSAAHVELPPKKKKTEEEDDDEGLHN